MTLTLSELSVATEQGALIFQPVSAVIEPSRPLAITGPSGVGKTSLLNAVAGFLPQNFSAQGDVLLGAQSIVNLIPEHRKVGVMFQNPLLFPHLNVAQNLGFALDKRAENREMVIEKALADAGLAGFGDRRPHTLSGGQRARVALIRALLAKPQALLLDEAFASLDPKLRAELREFTLDTARDIPVLMVTHDASDAASASDIIELLPAN